MVSESVSCPVSMMIGALKPPLRKLRTTSRPSVSGKPTSISTRSGESALAAMHALGAGIDRQGFEFLVQRQLLDQRLAQIGVVIHDQDLAGVGHWTSSGGACETRRGRAESRSNDRVPQAGWRWVVLCR